MSSSKWIAAMGAVVLIGFPLGLYAQHVGSVAFSGEYHFFSGTVGEKGPPTKKDMKVGLSLSGALALRMYQSMGSAAHIESCGDGDDDLRLRGDLLCSRNKLTGKAECDVGIDLHSGKSVLSIDPC